MPVMRSVARMLWPSVRQAMIWICWSRERTFMRAESSIGDGPVTVLEKSPCKAYIPVGRFLWGRIPGLMIRGRCGCNRDGPTGLMVEAVRFELTGPCEGFGRPKV